MDASFCVYMCLENWSVFARSSGNCVSRLRCLSLVVTSGWCRSRHIKGSILAAALTFSATQRPPYQDKTEIRACFSAPAYCVLAVCNSMPPVVGGCCFSGDCGALCRRTSAVAASGCRAAACCCCCCCGCCSRSVALATLQSSSHSAQTRHAPCSPFSNNYHLSFNRRKFDGDRSSCVDQ